MKITSANYVKSVLGTDEIMLDGKFQVAFIGRSNVGKSTLINTLVGIKGFARSSSTPGKTTKLDFFLIDKSFYFVDLPGYGYASHGSEMRDQIAQMIRWYILDSEISNRLIVLIIDANIGLTPYDLFVLNALREKKINHVLVANKVDKLKMGQKQKLENEIRKEYGDIKIFFCSTEHREGSKELMNEISSRTT